MKNQNKMVCPKCGNETKFSTEKRPNGNSLCFVCSYSGPTSSFYKKNANRPSPLSMRMTLELIQELNFQCTLDEFMNLKEDELIRTHHYLGRYIRNVYLKDEFMKDYPGEHRDDVSFEIIQLLHKTVKDMKENNTKLFNKLLEVSELKEDKTLKYDDIRRLNYKQFDRKNNRWDNLVSSDDDTHIYCQNTEVKDCKGKDIYEFDKVWLEFHYGDNFITRMGYVKYQAPQFVIMMEVHTDGWVAFNFNYFTKIEVVGSIVL